MRPDRSDRAMHHSIAKQRERSCCCQTSDRSARVRSRRCRQQMSLRPRLSTPCPAKTSGNGTPLPRACGGNRDISSVVCVSFALSPAGYRASTNVTSPGESSALTPNTSRREKRKPSASPMLNTPLTLPLMLFRCARMEGFVVTPNRGPVLGVRCHSAAPVPEREAHLPHPCC
jgi:hypothetical protein